QKDDGGVLLGGAFGAEAKKAGEGESGEAEEAGLERRAARRALTGARRGAVLDLQHGRILVGEGRGAISGGKKKVTCRAVPCKGHVTCSVASGCSPTHEHSRLYA